MVFRILPYVLREMHSMSCSAYTVLAVLCSQTIGLVIQGPQDRCVVQRARGESTGMVVVSVRCNDALAPQTEAAVVSDSGGDTVAAWRRCDKGGQDSLRGCTLCVPQGGWYRVAVRALDSSGTVVSCTTCPEHWAVGMNILCIGQSNMVGNGQIHTYTPVVHPLSGLYGNDNRWCMCADPYDRNGSPADVDYDSWIGVSAMPALVNGLYRLLPGVPVGIVSSAKGGTSLCGRGPDDWGYRNPSNHADTMTLYGNAVHNARNAGGVEHIIMHQGETDATDGTTAEEYVAALRAMLGHFHEDLGDSVPLFYCQLARAQSSDRNRTDVTMQTIRNAQLNADDGRHLLLSALCIDFELHSGDHYVKDGYDTLGGRLANAVGWYHGASSYYRGPAIGTVVFRGTARDTVLVAVRHRGGTDITPDSAMTGFEVFDSTGRCGVMSAWRLCADTIALVLSSRVAGNGTVRYLYGKSPNTTSLVRDNTTLRLPLEPTTAPLPIGLHDVVSSRPDSPARR